MLLLVGATPAAKIQSFTSGVSFVEAWTWSIDFQPFDMVTCSRSCAEESPGFECVSGTPWGSSSLFRISTRLPKPSAEAPAPYLNQPGREVPERGAPGRPRPPAAAFGRCMAKRSSE